MLGVFLLLGHHFSMAIVSLIPLTALVIIMAMGIGMVLGILNVFLRDIGLVQKETPRLCRGTLKV
jgi:lipopolysaccharide transport system permease protein